VRRGGAPLPRVEDLSRHDANDILSVATYRLPGGDTVVEAYDEHRLIAARTVVAGVTGSCEEVTDVALAATHLERCGTFSVEPLGKRQRLNALVCLRATARDGVLQSQRRLHEMDVAGQSR